MTPEQEVSNLLSNPLLCKTVVVAVIEKALHLVLDNPRRTISFSNDGDNIHFILILFSPAHQPAQTFYLSKTNVIQLALQKVTPAYDPLTNFPLNPRGLVSEK